MDCESCLFWSRFKEPDENRGVCKRYPPKIHADYINKDMSGGLSIDNYSAFPETTPDEWCGEWKENQSSISES